MGLAYVRFAVEEPGRFALMFGPKELHGDRPGYQQVCNAAFDVLMDAVRELRTDLEPDDPDVLRAAAGAWSRAYSQGDLDAIAAEAVALTP
jgi:hypothetical protein